MSFHRQPGVLGQVIIQAQERIHCLLYVVYIFSMLSSGDFDHVIRDCQHPPERAALSRARRQRCR